MAGISIVTPVSTYAVLKAEVKAHLNITTTDWDDLIDRLIKAAQDEVERFTNMRISVGTYDYYMDQFPTKIIEIPFYPVKELTVKYQDTDDAEQTLSSALYNTDFVSRPSRIQIIDSFPATMDEVNAVVIRLVTGFSTDTQTSGTLVVGKDYKLTDWITNDDFTNVGAASNADAVEFTATGTTPTTWTNSSVVDNINTIPEEVKQAIILLTSDLFLNKCDVVREKFTSWKSLAYPYRQWNLGNV